MNILSANRWTGGISLSLAAGLLAIPISGFAENSPIPPQEPPASIARPVKGKVWSFKECLDWARLNSTQVRNNLVAILEADQDLASAKDAWLPSVGFSTNQSVTNYPSSTEGRSSTSYGSNYGISANWTLWDGNIRKYRIENSRLLRLSAESNGENILKELELGILSAYINILYAQEALQIAEQTLEVSTSQAERAKKLMESGRSSKVDYAQIESQRAQDAYGVAQAQANVENAILTLKKILQFNIDEDLQVAPCAFDEKYIPSQLPTAQQVFDQAAAWVPELKSNTLATEIARNEIKIAKASLLPSISVSGGVNTGYASGKGSSGWGYQMGHNFNENLGLTLSVPIFDANSSKRAQAKARLAVLDSEINRDALLSDLSQTIESLFIESDNARARYKAAIPRLEAAEMTNTLVNRQFELGAVNPLELLTAHNNLLSARLEAIQNRYMALLADKTINYYATRELSLP